MQGKDCAGKRDYAKKSRPTLTEGKWELQQPEIDMLRLPLKIHGVANYCTHHHNCCSDGAAIYLHKSVTAACTKQRQDRVTVLYTIAS